MDQIKQIFSNSQIDICFFSIYLNESDSIPADLLGSNPIKSIDGFKSGLTIYGASYGASSYASLSVDSNAFRSSKDTLQNFEAEYLDTELMDFTFLTGFQKIRKVELNNVLGIDQSLRTLPALPTMDSLYIYNATNLNEVFQTVGNPLQVDGLKLLWAYGTGLDAKSLANLLNWLAPSSVESLREIKISSNNIETIPSQLRNFSHLQTIDISNNKVAMTILASSFIVPRYTTMTLAYSRVVEVEAGAFQGIVLLLLLFPFYLIRHNINVINWFTLGIFNDGQMDMSGNLLTRFEEGVFKPILEDMYNSGQYLDWIDVSKSM